MVAGELLDHAPRAIPAAVVDEDELVLASDRLEDRFDPSD